MARAVGEFQRFARFEPEDPRLRPDEYAARVWAVIRRAAWRAPLPAARRVRIPGYASPVQLFVTDFPRIELNHSVLAFDDRASGPGHGPAPLCGVVVSRFRAFRQYYSPLI